MYEYECTRSTRLCDDNARLSIISWGGECGTVMGAFPRGYFISFIYYSCPLSACVGGGGVEWYVLLHFFVGGKGWRSDTDVIPTQNNLPLFPLSMCEYLHTSGCTNERKHP